jgi:CubicO group peptidase (beta-lactamase class C family)
MPFERYVAERLLQPLGLERTTWRRAEPAAHGYYVHPFADTARREPAVEKRATAAAGALWSTAPDLCRWMAFLAEPDGGVLSAASVEEMVQPQVMYDPDGWSIGWGHGLMLHRREHGILAGHDGATVGFVAFMTFSRARKIGSAWLMNTGMPDPGFDPFTLTEKALELWPEEPEPWRPGAPVPPEVEPLLGIWWSEGVQHVFRWRGGRLEAVLAWSRRPQQPAVFEQVEPDAFRTVSGREQGEWLRVVRDDSGQVTKLYWATYPFLRTPTTFAMDS